MNRSSLSARLCGLALGLGAFLAAAPLAAVAAPSAGAYLVFDAKTGEIIARHNADQAWYPASITKLMTTWVTFQAIRAGRLTPSSPVPMTAQGARQPPSKMGFAPGQIVTVDNALKIIMVKSANDVAWALGEAVGGSKEAFVAEMNRQAVLLGMTSTHWGNPNGLPDPSQTTTARDLGILARALLRDFPEADPLWHLPGIQFGNDVVRNHNQLIDHFPGSDGMKTGFICASGFNVVATATRGNRRLVTIVLGSRTARARSELAAELFTKGFESQNGTGVFGRFTTPETLDHMARGPEAGNPVRDVKAEICGKKKQQVPDIEDFGDEGTLTSANAGAVIRPGEPGAQPVRRTTYLGQRFDPGPPVRVWLGGNDAAPPDGSTILALAPDARTTTAAPLFAAPTPPIVAVRPGSGPGAVGGGGFGLYGTAAVPAGQPATGPGPGAGLGAALPPADGAPLVITAPGVAPTAKIPAAARTTPPGKAAVKLTAKTAPDKPVVGRTTAVKPIATKAPATRPAAAKSAKPAATATRKLAPGPTFLTPPSSEPSKAAAKKPAPPVDTTED